MLFSNFKGEWGIFLESYLENSKFISWCPGFQWSVMFRFKAEIQVTNERSYWSELKFDFNQFLPLKLEK